MRPILSQTDYQLLAQKARVFRAEINPKNTAHGFVYFQLQDGEWVPIGWKEDTVEPRSFIPGLLFVGEHAVYRTVGGNEKDGAIDFLQCATLQVDLNS